MIYTQYFTLDIKKPPVTRLKIVNGDTANRFVIQITEDNDNVTLDTTLHKIVAVFTRADGQVYTQDGNTGVTFTSTGEVTINVRPASFRTGTNKVTLQIYKRESSSATEYPLLLTTQSQPFNARAAAIPESGAPNAPSQLPMLEQIIHDAGEAVTNCNNATTAANNAATAANNAASAANSAATAANNAASAATAAKNAANSATTAAESAAAAADGAAQNADAKAGAANTAAAAANAAATAANNAAAAAASRVGVRYIMPTSLTWNEARTVATGTLGVTRSEIDALLDAGTLVAIYEGLDDSHEVMYPVSSDDVLYYSSLPSGWSNVSYYYTAEITGNDITIFYSKILSVPDGGTAGQVLTCTEHGYAWADLPTYNGGAT